MSVIAGQVDLEAVKAKQQKTWASGDFSVVAGKIVLVSEQLADSADLRAGSRVLDVACGNGNATLAAARSGAHVVGVDYVPALLADGRARAVAEGLDVEFVLGDAEDLPLETGTVDAVLSVFGTMFAPDHRRTGLGDRAGRQAGSDGRARLHPGRLHRRDVPGGGRASRPAGWSRVPVALGDREPPARPVRAGPFHDALRRADLHVPVHRCRGVRRVLPPVVRADC